MTVERITPYNPSHFTVARFSTRFTIVAAKGRHLSTFHIPAASLYMFMSLFIPIEWKYTETYQGKEADEESLIRYPKLIDSASNFQKWDDLYKADPYYELMRQTLLMEQIIKQKDINGIKAVDFRHIMVIPNAHIWGAKQVVPTHETKFCPKIA